MKIPRKKLTRKQTIKIAKDIMRKAEKERLPKKSKIIDMVKEELLEIAKMKSKKVIKGYAIMRATDWHFIPSSVALGIKGYTKRAGKPNWRGYENR